MKKRQKTGKKLKEKQLISYKNLWYILIILIIVLVIMLNSRPEPILPSPIDNIIAYYSFNDDSNDDSGNGNNGIAYGASFVEGNKGQALKFDGVDDYIDTSDFEVGNDKITISAWVKSNEQSTQGIVVKGVDSSIQLIFKSNGRLEFFVKNSSGSSISPDGNSDITDDTWHHVVGVYNGTTVYNYVDGVKQTATGLLSGNIADVANNWQIGKYAGTNWFNGTIDEVKIWNITLTKEEILAEYRSSEEPPEDVICTSNWTEISGDCTSSDIQTISYTDTNDCGIEKSNTTRDCDSNHNNIIGRKSDIDEDDINIDEVEIDGDEYDKDDNYTDIGEEVVELIEGNITRVEFEWDFDDDPLNFKQIEIKKQDSNDNFGYLIINGINKTKTVIIDKLISSSNSVCVENRHIDDIDDISDDCDKSREYLVPCPGNKGSYECKIVNNKFKVSGITRSGIREFSTSTSSTTSPPTPSICTTSWTCGSWSSCINNQKTRICIDSNSCGTTTGKPSESESCNLPCTPSWDCGNVWTPSKCPKDGKQTRTCTDTSTCGTSSRTESRICTPEEGAGFLFYIIIIVLVLLILGVIIAIISASKKNEIKSQQRQKTQRINVIQPQTQPQTKQPRFRK